MPYVDRTVFTTNDQSSGEVADPNKLEANDSHLADVVDANYKELFDFVNGNKVSKLQIINVKDHGAKGDGVTDDSEAIQAADDELTSGGIIYFPVGRYFIGSQINKSAYSNWVGQSFSNYVSSSDSTYGTVLILGHDGIMINVDEGGTVYANGGINNMTLFADHTTYPNAHALNQINGVRQTYYKNLYIRGFVKFGLKFSGGGEIYVDDVFIVGSEYPLWFKDVSDSWIHRGHYGTGYVTGNAGRFSFESDSPMGSGMYLENCQNVTIETARPQVSTANGMQIKGCDGLRLIGVIADQSQENGLNISDSRNIDIVSSEILDNGTTSNKKPGIYISATSGNTTENINIIGGRARDRDKGTSYETQDRGVLFAGSGTIQNISIVGFDVTGVATPFAGVGNVSNLNISDCQGYKNESGGSIEFSGDGSTTTFNIPHGLIGTPNQANVTPKSPDARGNYHIFASSTNIQVIFATAPPSGANNVDFYWTAHI